MRSASTVRVSASSGIHSSGSPGFVMAFGLSCAAASATATLFNASACDVANTQIWTLVACPGRHEGISFVQPLPFGASGVYLAITGTGSAMLAWA